MYMCMYRVDFCSHISPSVIPDEFRLSERIQKRCKFHVSLLLCDMIFIMSCVVIFIMIYIFYCSCSAAQRAKCCDLSGTASQALSTGY